MKQSIRYAAVALAAAAALAGCGGHSDNGAATATSGSDLPDSALQSVEGLVAWANDQIANHTSSTTEPLVLGNVTLPTSDTREPI